MLVFSEENINAGGLDSSAVERQPFKLVVEGSIPSWGASFCEKEDIFIYEFNDEYIIMLLNDKVIRGMNVSVFFII